MKELEELLKLYNEGKLTGEQMLDMCEPMVVFFGPTVDRHYIDCLAEGLRGLYKTWGGKDVEITFTPCDDPKPGGIRMDAIPVRK
jgi:hypothetical protein